MGYFWFPRPERLDFAQSQSKEIKTVSIKLVCPESKCALVNASLAEAEKALGGALTQANRTRTKSKPAGRTDRVMLRADRKGAYPIIDGHPILLCPEQLVTAADRRVYDLSLPQYAEAYEEMDHYNKQGLDNAAEVEKSEWYFAEAIKLSAEERLGFPYPWRVWLDAAFDTQAQWECYRHIGSVVNKAVMQLGGSGIHTVKFLLAGAAEAWLATPMLGELQYATAMARNAGVADRFRGVVCVGEELPFPAESIDAIFSGGCVHHMDTEQLMPEVFRVLRPGGAFAATDPWKAPLHTFGTRLLGKREKNVYCRPIDNRRLEPLFKTFAQARAPRYGAVTRYPALALSKFGINLPLPLLFRVSQIDDVVAGLVPPFRNKWGSSIALLARK